MVDTIYLKELQLNITNNSVTEVPFQGLNLSTFNEITSTTINVKWDALDFDIVNLLFLDRDVSRATFCGIFISQ